MCVVIAMLAITSVATAATVNSISPSSTDRPLSGFKAVSASIYGTGFPLDAQVRLVGGGTTISASGETAISSTHIQCILNIPSTAYLGDYTLYVGSAYKTNAFKVTSGTVISSISPSSIMRPLSGSSTMTAVVNGGGFRSGAQVKLTGGSTTIYATGETTSGSTQIRCALNIPSTASLGSYTVWVQNPRSVWVARSNAFVIRPSLVVLRSVSKISPSSAYRPLSGFKTMTAYVYGTGFASGAQVKLTGGSTTIDAKNEVTVGSGQIRCTLTVPSTAYVGYYTVSVQNPGVTWVSKSSAFRVVATPVLISSISPSSANRPLSGSRTMTAYVYGSGFASGAQVKLTGGSTTIDAKNEVTAGSGQIRCTLTVPSTAYVGYYTVAVQNPGDTWVSKSSAFRVVAPVVITSPKVSGISPNSYTGGGGVQTSAVITGTGFVEGAKAKLQKSGSSFTFSTIRTIWVSPTRIEITFIVPRGLSTAGYYDVKVTNPNGMMGTLSRGFRCELIE